MLGAVVRMQVLQAHGTRAGGRRRRRGVLAFAAAGDDGAHGRLARGLAVVDAHASLLLRWMRRATRVRIRTIATSVSADPHARSTMFDCAWRTSLKIWTGSEFICSPTFQVVALTANAVNSSGAVSPAPRATASIEPVTRPGSAVGSTTRTITRQRGAPSAS